MAITKSLLETRLMELRKKLEQLVADSQAVSGAMQLCEQLIAEVDTPEAPNV